MQCNQQSGEKIKEYLAELRQLAATHCSFANHLDEALCDRLVCGLTNENLQKRLLSEEDLDLKRALKIAQGMEAASKNTQMLRDNSSASVRSGSHDDFSKSAVQMKEEEIVDRVGRYSRPRETNVPGKKCYWCGRSDHLAHGCIHKDTVCHNCNKRGHLARVC